MTAAGSLPCLYEHIRSLMKRVHTHSQPPSLIHNLILPYHLRLGLSSDPVSSGFPINFACISHVTIYATCPASLFN